MNNILSYRDPNIIKELAEKDKRIEELESEVELLLSITNLMINMREQPKYEAFKTKRRK